MTNSKAMKELRKKRKINNKCTRCGREVYNKEKTICFFCRVYLDFYKENGYPPPKLKLKVVNRSPVNEIKNEKLVSAMEEKSKELEQKIGTKKLAREIGSSTRSVQRWIFEGREPSNKFKKKVNNYFGKKIFKL
ncbi:MAG: hypothetical protein ACOCV1_03420 [Bacillota bacterium]